MDDGTMTSEETFLQRPEHAECGFQHFPSRLKGLRKTIMDSIARAKEDQKAFDIFVQHNPKSTQSPLGCPEWEGSAAQRCLKKDTKKGNHLKIDPYDLWELRELHWPFPLKVFRDHTHQELRTQKRLHQLQATGKSNWKDHREQLMSYDGGTRAMTDLG